MERPDEPYSDVVATCSHQGSQEKNVFAGSIEERVPLELLERRPGTRHGERQQTPVSCHGRGRAWAAQPLGRGDASVICVV